MAKQVRYYTGKKSGKKKSYKTTSIRDSTLKAIRHNIYLAKKYNKKIDDEALKNPVVSLRVGGIKDYKKLLKTHTKKEVEAIIKEETKSLTLPKTVKKLVREINATKEERGGTGKVGYAGTYFQYKKYGYQETRRFLSSALRHAEGYAYSKHVYTTISLIKKTVAEYQSRSKQDRYTEAQHRQIELITLAMERDVNKIPYTMIEAIERLCYDHAETTINPVEFITQLKGILTNSGISI